MSESKFQPTAMSTSVIVRKGVPISARCYDARGNCHYERLPAGRYLVCGTCHLFDRYKENKGLILLNAETRTKYYAVI